MSNLRTSYFTFGQTHVHSVNGRTFDKNTVVKITAADPRKVMFDTFGIEWEMEYENNPPNMTYFRENNPPNMPYFREIIEL